MRRRRERSPSGRAALVISILAVVISTTGLASAARHDAANLIDGHQVSSRPKPGGVLLLGRDRRFPAAAIPTVASALRADNALRLEGMSGAQLLAKSSARSLAGCPAGTVDIGSWCLMTSPYPIASAQAGLNNYFWASQACAAIGGYLPTAAQLIGAAAKVKLESTIDDDPNTATVQTGDGPKSDQREMTATLVTTAAGSEGVSSGSSTDPSTGQPQPVPQPSNPAPSTLQYVTVYSNHTKGGFAGSEPVSNAENFRCAFNLRQGAGGP